MLLALLAVFPLYYELGRTPIQLWDESRLAVNTVEMARDGHWLAPYFDGKPDHWNTKPPLLIWLEALSFKAFGYSTWSFRLPTFLATLGTVLLLFRFAARGLGRPLAGLLACMVLASSVGYVRLHVARTGDYDALLTCWQVLVWTQFFQYLETGTRRHLVWVALGLVAATLTKGPAGLLGLPGLLAYALARGKLWWLVRRPGVYAAAGAWVVVVAGYFVVRETVDPGYWAAVQYNDLGGRFLTALSGHSHPWYYYLENLQTRFFDYWLWGVVPALLAAIFLQPSRLVKRAVGLLTAFIVGWLVIISLAQSKLEWYDASIYPALALLLGLGLSVLCQDLLARFWPRASRSASWLAQAVLIMGVFYAPYRTVVRQFVNERHSDYGVGSDGHLGRYVTKLRHEQPQIQNLTLLSRGAYYSVLLYYKAEFEQAAGHELIVGNGAYARQLPVGRTVALCDPAYRAALDSSFQVVELHHDSPCQTLLLLPRQK